MTKPERNSQNVRRGPRPESGCARRPTGILLYKEAAALCHSFFPLSPLSFFFFAAKYLGTCTFFTDNAARISSTNFVTSQHSTQQSSFLPGTLQNVAPVVAIVCHEPSSIQVPLLHPSSVCMIVSSTHPNPSRIMLTATTSITACSSSANFATSHSCHKMNTPRLPQALQSSANFIRLDDGNEKIGHDDLLRRHKH